MCVKKSVRNRRLKNLPDVRRFLADVTNRLNRDEIDYNKASKLGYLLQILFRVIEGSDIEKRLSALEKIVKSLR